MAIFYRGDGPGSYWHKEDNDPRIGGFIAYSPGVSPSVERLITHIARASIHSPFVSLTRSFGIAKMYAQVGPAGMATRFNPGYIYEIEISDDKQCTVIDPIIEIAKTLPPPYSSISYQHDGSANFLKGIVDPVKHGGLVRAIVEQAPKERGTPRPANLSRELEALVRALRDAEVLVQGTVPAALVTGIRHEIY
jgi:hypothetical protein